MLVEGALSTHDPHSQLNFKIFDCKLQNWIVWIRGISQDT